MIIAIRWKGNSSNKSHQVGKKQANGYGLFDMNGNVGELVWNDDNEEDECDV